MKNYIGIGIGACCVLYFLLLVAKLTNTINWSWWWVTSPLWVCATVIMGVAFIAAWFASERKG